MLSPVCTDLGNLKRHSFFVLPQITGSYQFT